MKVVRFIKSVVEQICFRLELIAKLLRTDAAVVFVDADKDKVMRYTFGMSEEEIEQVINIEFDTDE